MDAPYTPRGGRYSQTFTAPGTYSLFCDLHPMTMHQTVTVRPQEGSSRSASARVCDIGGGHEHQDGSAPALDLVGSPVLIGGIGTGD